MEILSQLHIEDLLRMRAKLTDQILEAVGMEIGEPSTPEPLRKYYEEILSKNAIINAIENEIDTDTDNMKDDAFNSQRNLQPSALMNYLRAACDPNMAGHAN